VIVGAQPYETFQTLITRAQAEGEVEAPLPP
jgi:hypothetical protein